MANSVSPRQVQGSLFDIMVNQIDSLDKENIKENDLLEELLYGTGQTNRTARNSTQNSLTRNNQSTVQHRGANTSARKNTGSMGVKQSRKTTGSREVWGSLFDTTPDKSMETGRDSGTVGGVLRHGDGRLLQVGNLPKDGDRHGTLNYPPIENGFAPKQKDIEIYNEYLNSLAENNEIKENNEVIAKNNYKITEADNLGKGGAKAKFQDNINAIKLLNTLDNQERNATTEEQQILAKYVGWGGLPQVFDKENSTWEKEFTELKELLTQDDYEKARRSTQDAHFTSETVITGMYQGLARLGVNKATESLKILEPSAGTGNFIGLKPDTFNAKFYTVEQDPISAKILNYLYPNEHNLKASYQDVNFGNSIFDVAIGNPPFGNQKLFDKNFPQLNNFSIHNYFIAKSMDCVKDGGVGAFVVSRYFLEAHNSEHREYLADKNHFLGAIRLPHTAFKENALTDVTTDIIFLQKKTKLEKEQGIKKGHDWIKLEAKFVYDNQTEQEKPAYINEYFINNPEQILGKMEYVRGQFADELRCVAPENYILEMGILNAVQALPRNVFDINIVENNQKEQQNEFEKKLITSDYYKSLKQDSFLVNQAQKKVYTKQKDKLLQDILVPVKFKNDTAFQRINGMIEIRDSLRNLLNLEKSNAPDNDIEKQRQQLNIKYDHFLKKFGHLNSQTNRSLFKDDPESSLVQSLETNFDKGISKEFAQKSGKEYRPPSATKATIFSKRVLEYVQPAQTAENALDALSISLRESGKINFERIAGLLNRSTEEVQAELQQDNLIFKNPQSREWEIKDKYLVGNVKEKLRIAKAYAENNPEYQKNVYALTDVIPKDIEAVDIGVKFGSTWLPSEVLSDFIDEKIGGVNIYGRQLNYLPVLGKWEVKLSIYDNTINKAVWGTPEYPAEELIKSILTNRTIKVEKEVGRDTNNKPIMKIDQEATDVALQKAEEIQQAFSDWIWENDDRRGNLTKIYNDRFNTHVTPHYDGSHIELLGASNNVKLRQHQKDVVWRSIQEGTALFDHVVGAGKTLAAIATIKESKRMGFNKKPMVVVPNHLVYQWRDEFYRLYPDANILVAEKSDFLKENRERFFGKVATGNWDAVIVAHSSFKKIDMPKDIQTEILQEQIDAVIDALENAKAQNANKSTVKQLEKQKEHMNERFKKLLEQNNEKDRGVDFSDLGVDALFVDEAHEFKNLSFSSSMNVSGLGNMAGSAKALDLFVKCRYLQRQNEGKGVYFLTGTPISNTIAEVYNMQRYLQFDELKAKEIDYFDAWASTFGKITNKWELDSTGVNYKLKERFANFENVPELLSMYRTFADVVTKADIDEQLKKENKISLTPSIKNGKPNNHTVERSDLQAKYMEEIISRMEHLPKDPREDNPLKITNDARKAGLDYRLIDPTAPDFAGSKVNACANRIYELWEESIADRGTQLVFCDLSTPKGHSQDINPSKEVEIIQDNEFGDVEKDEAEQIINMDEVLAGLAGNGFSVYDDLKKKLIAKGIPNEEIAFIHDANTDIRKAKLFSDMNKGSVRILIGSTSKMGAGMNVQERLVSAHHLDAPWRSADLEQRNGRIIRQGNSLYEKDPNFEVEINYYATKQTYDARMWQTIEYKANAIEQFRKGDVLQRSIDDIQSEASNAAEMKAAASGNPLILQEVNLNTEKRKLEALYSQYNRSKYRLEDRLKYLQNSDKRYEIAQNSYDENIQLRDKNTKKIIENGKEKIKVELITSDNKRLTGDNSAEMQNLFIGGAKEVMNYRNKKVEFGNYRGFDVAMKFAHTGGKDGFRFTLANKSGQEFTGDNLVYAHDDKISLTGLFQRMDNFLEKEFDQRLQRETLTHQREKQELPTVQNELLKGFNQADDLKLTRDNHNAVLRELKRIQEDTAYISDWKPKTMETFSAEKVQEIQITETKRVETTVDVGISI